MNVPRVRPNLAVMSIFRSLRVPALGRLEMAELRAQWPRYALRRLDLDRSIDRLESLGFVEIDHTRTGLKYVVLTEMGFRSAHSPLGFFESLMTWPRRLFPALGRMARTTSAGDPRRRLNDRTDPRLH
jgi:hypothetical protein